MIFFIAKLLTGLLVCATATVLAQDTASYSSEFCSSERRHCRASIRHIEAGGIGYNHGYTTLDAFFAPNPDSWAVMPFFDLRGHVFDDGNLAANVGIGLRGVAGHRVYGLNAYYDYRNTKKTHYDQVGLGLETLGRRWDFRINGYVPIERKITLMCEPKFTGFLGHHMMLEHKYQFAMSGTNAELGCHFGKFRIFDFYAAASPYFFKGKIGPNVWGGKVRLLGKFTEYVAVELSNSYDNMFHNRFQCQLTLTLPFGGESCATACDIPDTLFSRMVQTVDRQEIIVVGNRMKNMPALDPATGEPFRFVFVNNTSSSRGTYESPYPTLALAQAHSEIGDIIYVFPGDGTTKGMDAGIVLQLNQRFWGSGVSHTLATSQGDFAIPAQSSSAPTMTNTNIDSEGDGITLAPVNEVSGFVVTDVLRNAIAGADVKSLDVSDCIILNSQVDAMLIESGSSGMACTVSDCTIQDNIGGGCTLSFDGPSTLTVSENTFSDNTSISSPPIIITAGTSPLTATITNNTIRDNTCGAVRFILEDTDSAQLTMSGNIITNNDSGSQGPLGAPLLISPNGSSVGNCKLDLRDNVISANRGGGALYCAEGDFNNFEVNAAGNTVTDNAGAGFVFANAANTFTLAATNNIISNGVDHGISTAGVTMASADIAISNNDISGNTNFANGIALSHSGIHLNFAVTDNNMSNNGTSGIIMFPADLIENVTVNITNNTINNNQNAGSNQAGGIDLEQFTNFSGTVLNNTLLNNVTTGMFVGSSEPLASVCLDMSGNTSNTGYTLSNDTGTFNLAPCNVDIVNSGAITSIGVISPVQSCPGAGACPP